MGAAAAAASARPDAKAPPKAANAKPIVFPVVGPVTYQDDFGDARSDGPPHPGNDILAPRKAIAVAAESGKVTFWTTSATAGCMLYLHGDSGTTYLYIHLNNDRTNKNDNKGACVAGIAYAPGLKDGARVEAGEQVGFVGDSGDANGIHPHLHFEVHPGGGKAVDPYPYLQKAAPLLFYAKPGDPFTAMVTGTAVGGDDSSIVVQVKTLRVFPSGRRTTKLATPVTVVVPATAVVQDAKHAARSRGLSLAAADGRPVTLWTQPALSTLGAELGTDGALVAALVQLG